MVLLPARQTQEWLPTITRWLLYADDMVQPWTRVQSEARLYCKCHVCRCASSHHSSVCSQTDGLECYLGFQQTMMADNAHVMLLSVTDMNFICYIKPL